MFPRRLIAALVFGPKIWINFLTASFSFAFPSPQADHLLNSGLFRAAFADNFVLFFFRLFTAASFTIPLLQRRCVL